MNYKHLVLVSAILSSSALAQGTCTVSGPPGYTGPVTSSLTFHCQGTIPPVIQPPAPPPAPAPAPPPPPVSTACDASQESTPMGGKILRRQCAGQIFILPNAGTYSGNETDLGVVLGNKTYPAYSYTGSSPTFQITSGYYVALSFVPTATGAIQFVSNPSYGDGGTISLSTFPGGLTRGAAGVVCSLSYGASNSMYISQTSQICPVKAGQTYYLNLADVDINGNNMCYGSSSGTCTSSFVSYTLYTSH
jgi:hypothetical protein